MSARAVSAIMLPGPSANLPPAVMDTLFADVADGRRREILVAGFTVFADKGYDAGTMRDIAKGVGVTEPALYRHFSGKEELFLEILGAVGAKLAAETCALLDGIDPADIGASLTAAFADRRQAMRGYTPALRVFLLAAAHNDTFLQRFRDVVTGPTHATLARNVARIDAHFGIGRPAAEAEARVRTIMSLAVGTLLTSFVLGDTPESATAQAVLSMMGWPART